jgi:hypothetical protein
MQYGTLFSMWAPSQPLLCPSLPQLLNTVHLEAPEAAKHKRLELGAGPHLQLPQRLQCRGGQRQPDTVCMQLQLQDAGTIHSENDKQSVWQLRLMDDEESFDGANTM